MAAPIQGLGEALIFKYSTDFNTWDRVVYELRKAGHMQPTCPVCFKQTRAWDRGDTDVTDYCQACGLVFHDACARLKPVHTTRVAFSMVCILCRGRTD